MIFKFFNVFQWVVLLCWVVAQFEQIAELKVIHKLIKYYLDQRKLDRI